MTAHKGYAIERKNLMNKKRNCNVNTKHLHVIVNT